MQCHVTAYDENTGKRVWRGYSEGTDEMMLMNPEKTMSLGKPVGKDSSLKTWEGDQWEERRRLHLGLVLVRSEAQPDVLRFG